MKYTKYIELLAVLFFTACTTELWEQPSYDRNGTIQLVSRVIPFSDRDVTTRTNKTDAETQIKTLDYFIFGSDDKCVYHKPVTSTDPLLIEKSSSVFENLTDCYVVSIANGPDLSVTPGETTWEDISSQSVAVSGVSIPTSTGLTMIGRYPETGTFNFAELEQGTVLTIPVKSLFSKIVVNISVDCEDIIQGENMPLPTFTLSGYTVHNVATEVDFIGGTESEVGKKNGTDDKTTVNAEAFEVTTYGETVDGGNPFSFSFYLPERFLSPDTSAEEFQYPFGKGINIRPEDKAHRQRYKPLLAKGHTAYNSDYDPKKDKKATYVTLKGVYSDHQGHLFEVSYDLYVGNDNYGNFDIVRNNQYNNNVTIKGINNSNNQSDDLGSVSIDHRVDVQRGAPVIINLRRETLLDSHFEVRPMLIRKNGAYTGEVSENAKVKIQVIYDETPASGKNWIGLERSFGNGSVLETSDTYLVTNELSAAKQNVAGKRKYFTTDLTISTLASAGNFDSNGLSTTGGTTVVIPIIEADQRVWIYIDECTTVGDAVRSAKIQVSYATDGANYSEPIEYVLNQRMLYPVTYNNHSYNIEYHEEYLYNYDSDDQYGQTEYEGMKWGLNGDQLSRLHRAYFATGSFAGIMNSLLDANVVKPYYDFYLTRDINNGSATRRDNAGYHFCDEIIKTINGEGGLDKDDSNDIKVLNLSQDPKSAIEYCYNRNKRNADGTISDANIRWYLPAIDEIENIMMGAYTTFEVFQDKYYWSSQPAFLRGRGHYFSYAIADEYADYYYDDITYARSTKVVYEGNDKYANVTSGVDGYAQLMEIYKPIWGTNNEPEIIDVTSEPFTYTSRYDGKNFTTTLDKMTDKVNHPGNDPRDQRNRIRCVYYTGSAKQN